MEHQEKRPHLLRVRVTYTATIEIDAASPAEAAAAFDEGRYDGDSLQLDEMVDWEVRSCNPLEE